MPAHGFVLRFSGRLTEQDDLAEDKGVDDHESLLPEADPVSLQKLPVQAGTVSSTQRYAVMTAYSSSSPTRSFRLSFALDFSAPGDVPASFRAPILTSAAVQARISGAVGRVRHRNRPRPVSLRRFGAIRTRQATESRRPLFISQGAPEQNVERGDRLVTAVDRKARRLVAWPA